MGENYFSQLFRVRGVFPAMPYTLHGKYHKAVSRRRFLFRAGAVVGLSAAATFGYTWRIEPVWIETVYRPLPIANLPPGLSGKRLVQISDIHVGTVVNEAYITDAMRRVSALAPDVLVITGDFMTCSGPEQVPRVMRVLSQLAPGKLATVGILGNHDYGRKWSSVAAATALTDAVRGRGITLLRNQVTDVAGLQIGGVDDMWGPNFDPAGTLKLIDPAGASLMLCHNPDAVDLPIWSAYRGWILAGHTHGGQCRPPLLTPPLLPVKDKRYIAGYYDLFDGRSLYINRGLGYIKRLRFNARPEISVFTLVRA
jgi:predicted MPP superfamily phosphohydrolase